MPSAPIRIRLATTVDVDQVFELLLVQLHEHHIPIGRENLRRAIDAWLHDERRGFILVAENGSRIIGVSCVDFMWPLEHGGLGGWLEELYVIPEFRSCGVGSNLLDATIQECTRRGCLAIDLEVESDHARVETLYDRFGFIPITSRRRWMKKLAVPSNPP